MFIKNDKISDARQASLSSLDPNLQAICWLAMQSVDRLDGLQAIMKPEHDSWKQGYEDALKNMVKFITLAHVGGIDMAWDSFLEND